MRPSIWSAQWHRHIRSAQRRPAARRASLRVAHARSCVPAVRSACRLCAAAAVAASAAAASAVLSFGAVAAAAAGARDGERAHDAGQDLQAGARRGAGGAPLRGGRLPSGFRAGLPARRARRDAHVRRRRGRCAPAAAAPGDRTCRSGAASPDGRHVSPLGMQHIASRASPALAGLPAGVARGMHAQRCGLPRRRRTLALSACACGIALIQRSSLLRRRGSAARAGRARRGGAPPARVDDAPSGPLHAGASLGGCSAVACPLDRLRRVARCSPRLSRSRSPLARSPTATWPCATRPSASGAPLRAAPRALRCAHARAHRQPLLRASAHAPPLRPPRPQLRDDGPHLRDLAAALARVPPGRCHPLQARPIALALSAALFHALTLTRAGASTLAATS
jgi:hypothetical protein